MGLWIGSLALLADAAHKVIDAPGLAIAWGLLRRAGRLLLDAAPEGIDRMAVRARLAALPGVAQVHDLHIWPLSTTRTALTVHLVMPDEHPGDAFLAATARMLADDFDIAHATMQIDTGAEPGCALRPGPDAPPEKDILC